MPVHAMALIPSQRYVSEKLFSINGSIDSVRIDVTRKKLCHALKGEEKKILGRYVDRYDELTKTIYEFEGCLSHGCTVCYPNRDYTNPYYFQRMNTLYAQTQKKSEHSQKSWVQCCSNVGTRF